MKRKYPTLEEIPEAFRPLFTEQAKADGSGKEWVLTGIEGMVVTEKVQEFRATNERLMGEKEALQTKLDVFKGIDPEKYKDLLGKESKLAEGKLFDQGKIDEIVSRRTDEMKRDHSNQITALTEAKDAAEAKAKTLKTSLDKQVIDRTVIDAGSKFGLLPTAHLDLINRARSVAEVDENGALVFKNPDGSKMYGKDGVTLLTPEEWAERQATEFGKHMFKPNSGSGNEPTGGGGGGPAGGTHQEGPNVIEGRKFGLGQGEYNPFLKTSRNLSDGYAIQVKNPKLAEQLAKVAGFQLEPLPEKSVVGALA